MWGSLLLVMKRETSQSQMCNSLIHRCWDTMVIFMSLIAIWLIPFPHAPVLLNDYLNSNVLGREEYWCIHCIAIQENGKQIPSEVWVACIRTKIILPIFLHNQDSPRWDIVGAIDLQAWDWTGAKQSKDIIWASSFCAFSVEIQLPFFSIFWTEDIPFAWVLIGGK